MKNYQSFLSENFQFLELNFSIYLNRRVFVMGTSTRLCSSLSMSCLRTCSGSQEVFWHHSDTSWGSYCVVLEDIEYRSPFDFHQSLDTGLMVRIPDGGCVLQYTAYHCLVSQVLPWRLNPRGSGAGSGLFC